MAMTGAGLAAARKTAKAAIALPINPNDGTQAAAYADALNTADSTAIVTYIQGNQVVTSSGTDPQGGTVTSTSTVIA